MDTLETGLHYKEKTTGFSEWCAEEDLEELNQEGMGKRRRRGQDPQKGCRSDWISSWLTKREKKHSCSLEAQKAIQKQSAEKECKCS